MLTEWILVYFRKTPNVPALSWQTFCRELCLGPAPGRESFYLRLPLTEAYDVLEEAGRRGIEANIEPLQRSKVAS